MYNGTVNPEVLDLLIQGKFDWDVEWKLVYKDKIKFKTKVFRDKNKIKAVKTPKKIFKFKENFYLYAGDLLVITYYIHYASPYSVMTLNYTMKHPTLVELT